MGTDGRQQAGSGLVKSVYQVARELKREENSIFNCLNSIVADEIFVSEIRNLYPTLPLLANLRCGLWYTPKPDATCYFKSTDGHAGNWSFSTTRLNLHVADLAARRGGVIIVDATRKGKRFPDALTKTIPIWAAVVNRAVARLRAAEEARPVPPVADLQDCVLPPAGPGAPRPASPPPWRHCLQQQQQQPDVAQPGGSADWGDAVPGTPPQPQHQQQAGADAAPPSHADTDPHQPGHRPRRLSSQTSLSDWLAQQRGGRWWWRAGGRAGGAQRVHGAEAGAPRGGGRRWWRARSRGGGARWHGAEARGGGGGGRRWPLPAAAAPQHVRGAVGGGSCGRRWPACGRWPAPCGVH